MVGAAAVAASYNLGGTGLALRAWKLCHIWQRSTPQEHDLAAGEDYGTILTVRGDAATVSAKGQARFFLHILTWRFLQLVIPSWRLCVMMYLVFTSYWPIAGVIRSSELTSSVEYRVPMAS